ncbi:MAG TPA: hypothetical protein VL754_07150 [Verrucomicrobiae bacterium]|jgi:hypothetical protein|nr:hypothetical protein [Verrucomicrobiae bacterium]
MSRYERLNDLAWEERFRLRWQLVLMVCAFCSFAALFLFFMPDSVDEVSGTIITQHAESDDQGVVRRYLIVRLDTGDTVNAFYNGDAAFKTGRRIVVTVTTTKPFGYKRYKFGRYLERDEANKR